MNLPLGTNSNGFSSNPLNVQSEQSQNTQTLKPNSDEQDSKSVCKADNSFLVSGFLIKAFTNEPRDHGGLDHKLLVLAVHAVLLEFGFVNFNPLSNPSKSNNINFHANLHNSSFFYTLHVETSVTPSVKIKFQTLGKYCKVYGSLVNGPTTHWVLLDRLVPFLDIEAFEFWRKVKDELVLPLLIDLCEKSGLELPPCFTRLPTELKLVILDHLRGNDIAVLSCVCSEMKYLGSSEDLWERKYFEEFGGDAGLLGRKSFKERFVYGWESRKMRKEALSVIRRGRNGHLGSSFISGIIGGDSMLLPNMGLFGGYNQLRRHLGGGNPRRGFGS